MACESVDGPFFNLSTLQPFNLSTFQPFNTSTFQLFNLSTLQPFNFSTFQLFNLSPFQPFNLSTFQLFNFSTFQAAHLEAAPPAAAPRCVSRSSRATSGGAASCRATADGAREEKNAATQPPPKTTLSRCRADNPRACLGRCLISSSPVCLIIGTIGMSNGNCPSAPRASKRTNAHVRLGTCAFQISKSPCFSETRWEPANRLNRRRVGGRVETAS